MKLLLLLLPCIYAGTEVSFQIVTKPDSIQNAANLVIQDSSLPQPEAISQDAGSVVVSIIPFVCVAGWVWKDDACRLCDCQTRFPSNATLVQFTPLTAI